MKKLIMKLLGLDTLLMAVDFNHEMLRKENEELKKSLAELKEQVEEMEVPDMDDYVQHSDLDDNIESYLNNNDYATQDWVQGEIEDIDVSDKIEEAIDDLDIDSKVEEAIERMDKPSFGDTEELKDIVRTVLRDGKIKFE